MSIALRVPKVQWLRPGARPLGGAGVASILCGLLLVANVIVEPGRFALVNLGTTVGLFAPLALAAMASTPAILAGGFDLSIGPLMGVLNVVIVYVLIGGWNVESPFLVVPLALGLGAIFGAFNGVLHAVVRLPPMVATIATYIIYGGLAVVIGPAPGGEVPEWITRLSTTTSALPLIGALAFWWGVTRTSFYQHMMATGSDDRTAYACGVDIATARLGAYAIGGLFAGLAALSLTGLLSSADGRVGSTYVLGAIAAVALGGVELAGGRGGVLGSLVGAGVIFLAQGLITYVFGSPFALPISFGAMLILALCFNAIVSRRLASIGAAFP